MDKTFNDVITEVNKNGRSRELSVEEAIRWLCLKICAQVSTRKWDILHGNSIWDNIEDKDGKLVRKRKTNDDGTVLFHQLLSLFVCV
eukprot:323706_1